eukprot:scaffold90857_cov37-Tisochrysis_lutea.AAC.2
MADARCSALPSSRQVRRQYAPPGVMSAINVAPVEPMRETTAPRSVTREAVTQVKTRKTQVMMTSRRSVRNRDKENAMSTIGPEELKESSSEMNDFLAGKIWRGKLHSTTTPRTARAAATIGERGYELITFEATALPKVR